MESIIKDQPTPNKMDESISFPSLTQSFSLKDSLMCPVCYE
jgi:hypothetical protein